MHVSLLKPLEGAGIGLPQETSHGSFPLVILITKTPNGMLNHAIPKES